MRRKYLICLVGALVCSWGLILPTRAGQARVVSSVRTRRESKTDKPLDMKQIERLERQLSDIRRRIDDLRHINDPHTQNYAEYVAHRPTIEYVVMQFIGLYHIARYHRKPLIKGDFRVGDRVVTIRRFNGVKQITGYGLVAYVDTDEAQFESLPGSETHVEDEVYVISREDTSASLVNVFPLQQAVK